MRQTAGGWVVGVLLTVAAVGHARGELTARAAHRPGPGLAHTLPDCRLDLEVRCRALPPAARDRVHLLFVNGADPLCLGNVNGLCASFQRLGFARTSFLQLWQASSVAERIRQIRQVDRDARIILVGFSAGCCAVRSAANELDHERCPIDLLVYLAGDYITNTPRSRPANVRRLLNITGHGFLLHGYDLFFNGADLDGARNIRLDVRHMKVPSQRQTVEALVEEVLRIAEAVPH
jgi:hypothetical protein